MEVLDFLHLSGFNLTKPQQANKQTNNIEKQNSHLDHWSPCDKATLIRFISFYSNTLTC